MLLSLDRTIDRGCWISGDRVYAFLSSATNSIAEVGFHGPQPPSINSRVLVNYAGGIQVAFRELSGTEFPSSLGALEWFAAGAAVPDGPPGVELFVVEASRNQIVLRFYRTGLTPIVRISKASLFTSVHGTRTWTQGERGEGWFELEFRDRISLHSWLDRGGPYGGDFLIPEPVRRRIFGVKRRSGEATKADLLPEFRETPFDIYDSTVRLRIGGNHFVLTEDAKDWILTSPPPSHTPRECVLEFTSLTPETFAGAPREPGESPRQGPPVAVPSRRERFASLLTSAPAIMIPEYPATEEFFLTLPALAASALVGEWGIPRATPGRYYSAWAWDAIVTSLAGLRWGGLSAAASTIEFINEHRDAGGEIPMRWTGDLLPLDTQPQGALEALIFILAEAISVECDDDRLLHRLYPHALAYLGRIETLGDSRGFFPNIGFYPDLPTRFGRSDRSAVAIEIGAAYSFCRILESVAYRFGDRPVAARAGAITVQLETHFLSAFWDRSRGFLIDAIDLDTAAVNPSTPLFSLLFLCSSAGLPLLRPRMEECAEFIARQLLTPAGFRLLPRSDPHAGSETVSGAWYPHWDQYAIRILRRGGRAKEILVWLQAVERTLLLLGSCPELLHIDPILEGKPGALSDHGATSNLNCATGWYSALLEGLFGWEVDRGGVTLIPLALPFGTLGASGIVSKGTTFDITVENGGEELEEVDFDGTPLRGSLKLPAECYDRGRHRLALRYGNGPAGPRLLELINGEVLHSTVAGGSGQSVELSIRTFGRAEAVLSTPAGERVSLNGTAPGGGTPRPGAPESGMSDRRIVRIDGPGTHRILISPA